MALGGPIFVDVVPVAVGGPVVGSCDVVCTQTCPIWAVPERTTSMFLKTLNARQQGTKHFSLEWLVIEIRVTHSVRFQVKCGKMVNSKYPNR